MSDDQQGALVAPEEMSEDDRILLSPGPEQTGERLDVFVASQLPDLSRNFIQLLIANGDVLVDGSVHKRTFKVSPGQVIDVRIPEPTAHDIQPQELPLAIVYEDDHIAIVDKPAGMVVHPAAGHADGTLVNGLLFRYPEIAINGTNRPGIVSTLR